MSAKDVVAKAEAEGITLSPAQVYTARSTGKKAGSASGRGGAGLAVRKAVGRKSAAAADDPRQQFIRIAMRIGIDEAQALLDRVSDMRAN